jgi:hypothetical protein
MVPLADAPRDGLPQASLEWGFYGRPGDAVNQEGDGPYGRSNGAYHRGHRGHRERRRTTKKTAIMLLKSKARPAFLPLQ